MARTIDYVADVEQFARLVQLVKAIEELKVLVEETEVFIREYCNRDELGMRPVAFITNRRRLTFPKVHALRSAVSSSIHEKVDSLNQRFDQFTRQFDRGVNVQSAITVDSILKKLGWCYIVLFAYDSVINLVPQVSKEGDTILASLEPKDVNRNLLVGRCMKGTREGPLKEIAAWTEDFSAPNILWLKGHPGVGKSAIAASIIHQLRENRRLGSQFIFRRQESNVSTPHALWRSVAFDLSQQYPGIRQKIIVELDADPHLIKTDKSEELFEKLVYAPLAGMEGVPDGRLPVIVIDGLDECGGLDGGNSQHRKDLLATLSKWRNLVPKVKIIVTSREERDIETVLKDGSQSIELPAGANADHLSSEDITTFLKAGFKDIVAQEDLKPDWPGPEAIQELSTLAKGLFMWAKVVINFIADGVPSKQLERILKEKSQVNGMSSLYETLLNVSFHQPTTEILVTFRSMLGTIILSKQSLSKKAIADLCSIDPGTMSHLLHRLRSVVSQSGDILIITHQSFVDFLINPLCPDDFCLRLETEEARLTLACLETMKHGLQFNICGLESSYHMNEGISDMEMRVKDNISPHLSYSCWHWADHLGASVYEKDVVMQAREFMEVQFLFWLEVMSVMGRMDLALRSMSSVMNWMKVRISPGVLCAQDL
jgi:NACHT domain